MPVEVLDEAVVRFLVSRLFSASRCRAILEELVERGGLLRHRAAQERRRWEAEARTLDRRLAKLLDAVEIGEMPAGLVAGRLRDVTEALDAAKLKLAQVSVIHETPPQLNAPETLARFETMMREALVADVGAARAYLHALVGRVVIGVRGEVDVLGQAANARMERVLPWSSG